jgi:hypothetical protein
MPEDERQEHIPYDWEFIPDFVATVRWDQREVNCFDPYTPEEHLEAIRNEVWKTL